MSALVELYVREVSSGNMKIDEVPARLREKVESAIKAENTTENGVHINVVRRFYIPCENPVWEGGASNVGSSVCWRSDP